MNGLRLRDDSPWPQCVLWLGLWPVRGDRPASAFERGVASVAYAVNWVICECARRQIKIHDHDVISRIIILTEPGTRLPGRDITR
jgi:hypothetical protein